MKIKIKYDDSFSVPEVATILNVSEATVRQMVKEKKLSLGHQASNQCGFAIKGSSLREHLSGNPRYSWRDDTYEIPEEAKLKYLKAAKTRCMREIRAAEAILLRNTIQLREILNELFDEES